MEKGPGNGCAGFCNFHWLIKFQNFSYLQMMYMKFRSCAKTITLKLARGQLPEFNLVYAFLICIVLRIGCILFYFKLILSERYCFENVENYLGLVNEYRGWGVVRSILKSGSWKLYGSPLFAGTECADPPVSTG